MKAKLKLIAIILFSAYCGFSQVNQAPVNNQQPANNQPAANNQQPANTQSPANNQQPVNNQPSANNQQPANNQSPANNQQPVNNQPPINNQQPANNQNAIGQANNSGTSNTTANQDFGWRDRISFIVGGGVSGILNHLYYDPVVDKTTNNVIIERAGSAKPNMTIGILYTGHVVSLTRTVPVIEGDVVTTKTLIEYYPKGWSVALFLNPISIAKISDNFSNTVDLGMGFGYRWGSFSVLGTIEFFSIRQPKKYFISQYQDNDTQYKINGQVQTSFDQGDNTIYRSIVATSIGIKLCYTFDIIKSYYKTSTELATH